MTAVARGSCRSRYDGRGEEGIDVQLLKLHFESDVDFHRQVCKMAQISEAQWEEIFKRAFPNKPIGKANIFLTFVLMALVNFKWSQPSALLAEKTKQRISRILLDADVEKSKRSRFSTTVVEFALKTIIYYSDNEHFIACRAGGDVKQAIEHLNYFCRRNGMRRRFL